MLIERASYFDVDAISQSMMKDFSDKSPHHFFKAHIEKSTPRVDRAAFRKGRAFHAMLLEPDTFDQRYPTFSGEARTNEAKAEKAALEAQAEAMDGCILRTIGADAVKRIELEAMCESVRANRAASMLLKHMTHAEKAVVWTCPDTGVLCKSRLDGISEPNGTLIVFDVKKIGKVPTKKNIEAAIANYGYHKQAAVYLSAAEALTGRRPDDYWLIFVEDEAPFACAAYPIDNESLAIGDAWRRETLTEIAMRRASGKWDFQEEFTTCGLPEWARRAA